MKISLRLGVEEILNSSEEALQMDNFSCRGIWQVKSCTLRQRNQLEHDAVVKRNKLGLSSL